MRATVLVKALNTKLEGPHRNSRDKELQMAHTKAWGPGAQERPGGSVSTVRTHTASGQYKEADAFSSGEGTLVHVLESQDSTPRRGQEKETPYPWSEIPPRDKGPVWLKEGISEAHCFGNMGFCG